MLRSKSASVLQKGGQMRELVNQVSSRILSALKKVGQKVEICKKITRTFL